MWINACWWSNKWNKKKENSQISRGSNWVDKLRNCLKKTKFKNFLNLYYTEYNIEFTGQTCTLDVKIRHPPGQLTNAVIPNFK